MRQNRILAKLRSQRGASILFALLFFIVCAVIGSMVLAAGAAAAGRLADMEKMDQRYFAVTSAAKVLEHQLNDPSAVVTRRKVEDPDTSTEVWTVDGEDDSIRQILRDSVEAVADNSKGLKDSAAGAALDLDRTVALIHPTNDKLTTYVKLTMAGSAGAKGNLTITVRDAETVAEAKYFLILDCPAHVLTNTYHTGAQTETVETITWSVASVKKGGVG